MAQKASVLWGMTVQWDGRGPSAKLTGAPAWLAGGAWAPHVTPLETDHMKHPEPALEEAWDGGAEAPL